MSLGGLIREAGKTVVFHYTTVYLGEYIVEEQLFATGAGAAYGPGLYATHIAPEDNATLEDVIVHCFGGDAFALEVSFAIALNISDANGDFVEAGDGWEWLLPTPKLGHLDISTRYRGAALWNGHEWVSHDE